MNEKMILEEARYQLNFVTEEKESVEIEGFLLESLIELIEKKNKVISKIAEELEEITGSCPLDRWDWENKKCDNCNNTYKECFIEYFYKKAEE